MKIEGSMVIKNVNNKIGVDSKQGDNQYINKKNKQNSQNKYNSHDDEVKEHEIIQAIEQANKSVTAYDRKLEFSIHEKTKQIMVKVIDTTNDEVIREIPAEKTLDMVANILERIGLLVDKRI